ncbi:NADP-dependent alkenal double bond reductase P2-like protein [Linderina pennispora]|uniref:NADP-dependent alkenal double bond reductase P2-like protein n=1 Tax=Linderina pennispora TaxID=61395 RepID=A0A1Y1WCY7_9FUNG|nr:NADP-dependent alkenal double bond reductase P2-like protein [Linderina pennispora]ORX71245.1 NADP-dependent alkenal double bond reductase P2-like protein [Linderina pennispora]
MSSSDLITRVLANKYSPNGAPSLDNFKVVSAPAPTKDSLKENQVLVRNLYLSVDPYQRGRLSGATNSFVPRYELNEPIYNFGVAVVEAATSTGIAEGDIVAVPNASWETKSVVNAGTLRKLPTGTMDNARDFVTVFGMPSFTAFVGLTTIGKPKAGETILVSSASGAVGQIVVQLAKARGLRVVGVAGSDDKVELVKSIGADAAFNYKTCGTFTEAIKQAAPEGIDIYFDNVGGEFLDATLANINTGARIVSCGMISQYNVKSADEAYGLKNTFNIVTKTATFQGILVGKYYGSPTEDEFMAEVGKLYKEGKLRYRIDETTGLENAPQAVLNLFDGKSFGKSVVKV